MKVEKKSFGYLVWLIPEEQGTTAVENEISKLIKNDKVTILVSGNEDIKDILLTLIKVAI